MGNWVQGRAAAALSMLVVCCVGAGCDPPKEGAAPAAGSEAAHDYVDPAQCGVCHPTHYAQWEISNHAYAIADPVFVAMVELGEADTEGELDTFCVECHAPIGTRTDQLEVTQDGATGTHELPLDGLDARAHRGVTCDTCHTMRGIGRPANADFETEPDGFRRATLSGAVDNDFHASSTADLFYESLMCGTCHNVINELFTEPVRLESTFREWQVSRFNGSRDCQDCHMPRSEGAAALGGPTREIHDHTMVGVDVSLLPPEAFPGYEALREATAQLLRESTEWEARYDARRGELVIVLENLAGHAVPSGATADREMWIELLVTDADGETVFASGTLDAQGDLKQDNPAHTLEPGADPQLVVFRQRMLFDPSLEDPSSTEPIREVDFLWEPNSFEERLLPAGGGADLAYDLSALPPGDYDVQARLLFRSFPPHLLRKLVDAGLLDPEVPGRVPTVEMDFLALSISVE